VLIKIYVLYVVLLKFMLLTEVVVMLQKGDNVKRIREEVCVICFISLIALFILTVIIYYENRTLGTLKTIKRKSTTG